jgi:23S rRNA maturation mini-RNase III
MEKFITAPAKIELLTERINKLDENPEEILKIYKETNVTKLKKDLDVERERYKGVKNF